MSVLNTGDKMGKCYSRVVSVKKKYDFIDHLYDVNEIGIGKALLNRTVPSFQAIQENIKNSVRYLFVKPRFH